MCLTYDLKGSQKAETPDGETVGSGAHVGWLVLGPGAPITSCGSWEHRYCLPLSLSCPVWKRSMILRTNCEEQMMSLTRSAQYSAWHRASAQ